MFHDLIWSSVQPAFRNLIVSGGRNAALLFVGLSAGGIIAAGVFAFLVIIGVFPRLIGKTGTKRHILLYGTVIVSGGVLGNIADLYEFPIPTARFFLAVSRHLRTGSGNLCGMPGDVSGGDVKGTAGYQPENLSGGGAAVSDTFHCTGKTGRIPGVFSVRDGSGMMLESEQAHFCGCRDRTRQRKQSKGDRIYHGIK